MRIGLQLPSFCFSEGPPGIAARLREIAQAAEEGGFSSLWVMDHYFQIPLVVRGSTLIDGAASMLSEEPGAFPVSLSACCIGKSGKVSAERELVLRGSVGGAEAE
jgi:alkanesulfonate monooxygenase SsuD/methylene tetrahydromethanopterin reductase-like flavin-dependent oxidoreductase (luciferase family)